MHNTLRSACITRYGGFDDVYARCEGVVCSAFDPFVIHTKGKNCCGVLCELFPHEEFPYFSWPHFFICLCVKHKALPAGFPLVLSGKSPLLYFAAIILNASEVLNPVYMNFEQNFDIHQLVLEFSISSKFISFIMFFIYGGHHSSGAREDLRVSFSMSSALYKGTTAFKGQHYVPIMNMCCSLKDLRIDFMSVRE